MLGIQLGARVRGQTGRGSSLGDMLISGTHSRQGDGVMNGDRSVNGYRRKRI